MRMLGMGLLAFLLAGVLIVLGQTGAFGAAWDRLTGNDRRQFDDYGNASARFFDIEGKDVRAMDVDQGAPLLLSGMPSYANQHFELPIDSRAVSGIYNLSFTSEVADGVEGAVRVTINGIRRADVLLHSGQRRDSVDIELTPNELASGKITVGLSLQGRGPIAECAPDDSIAAIIEIEPESGLALKLAEPATSPRDLLALWGGHVPVRWDNGADAAYSLRSIVNSARLAQKGYRVTFMSDGLSIDELGEISKNAPDRSAQNLATQYPLPLVTRKSNSGIRRFGRQMTWRHYYQAGDLPGRILPGALNLDMMVGPEGGQHNLDLTVTMNDRLLLSQRLPNNSAQVARTIAIPAATQRSNNELAITLSSSDRNELRCGQSSQSVAELLESTHLSAGSASVGDALSQLRTRLTQAEQVTLSAPSLGAPEAQIAANLIAQLNARSLHFVTNNGNAQISVLAGDVSALAAGNDGKDHFLVHYAQETDEIIVARRADDPALNPQDLPAIALLISLGKAANDNQSADVEAEAAS